MIKASICTIGDEILIGQIIDTNSSHIALKLEENGINVTHMVSISDNKQIIINQINNELQLNDVVVVTGGLGPTKDDITKDALLELSGSSSYVLDATQAEIVRHILHSRGLDTLDINVQQAMVPDKCEVIPNKLGTAPIMAFHFPAGHYGHKASLYSMPGVPFETISALPDVLQNIKRHFNTESITHRIIMTYGLAESSLAKKIESWENSLSELGIHLAYLPNTLTGVRLRLSINGGNEKENNARIDSALERLRLLLGTLIYSEQDDNLQSVIGKLLKGSGKTLCCAESCTGGMIAHLLTTISGSSEYFLGSVTSYSPLIKHNVLGVSEETINDHGIVSAAVAEAMAKGVRKLMNSTYSVATTGWADSYGDDHEPAGTVWIAVDGPKGTQSRRFEYHADRVNNINRFAASALNFLREYILL